MPRRDAEVPLSIVSPLHLREVCCRVAHFAHRIGAAVRASRACAGLASGLFAVGASAQPAWTITSVNLPGVSVAWSIAFGNGRFVATMYGDASSTPGIGISTDGLVWRASAAPMPKMGTIVFAAGAFYLAVDQGIWRSTDGENWQRVYSTTGFFTRIATDGRSLLAAQNVNGSIYLVYSPDLTTWRETAPVPNSIPSSYQPTLAYAGGRYFVHYHTNLGPRAVSTTDGRQWTTQPALVPSIDLTSGNGRLVGLTITTNEYSYYSLDGSQFATTGQVFGTMTNGGGMGYAAGRFFFLGSLSASFDGVTWQAIGTYVPRSYSNITGIAYGNGRYVAVGNVAQAFTPSTVSIVAVLPLAAPPSLASEPQHAAAPVDGRATFSTTVENADASTVYNWYRNDVVIPGATASSLVLNPVRAADFGRYRVVVRNAVGTVTSNPADLTLALPPVVTAAPVSQSINAGGNLTLSVSATGTPPFTYAWLRNGVAIAGATGAALTLAPAQLADTGAYTVRVSNGAGSVTTAPATLTVVPVPVTVAPSFASATSARAGERVALSVGATGTPPFSFQWTLDGAPIAGATTASLTLNPALPAHSGVYQVTVTNPAGIFSSPATTLVVRPVTRISNVSVLTVLASPGETFSLGYIIGGLGTSGPKPVLIRAAGPALIPLGVGGAVDDPRLETFAGETKIAENDDWGGSPALAGTFAAVGAFPFGANASKDAALAATITTRNNSVRVSAAANGTGIVLAEVYDASVSALFAGTTPRFINVSILKSIGAGLTVGFTIEGFDPKRVLIRAIGPSLGTFGVPNAVADPELVLFDASAARLDSNDNWGGSPTLVSAFASIAAFFLPANSRDAALLATLPPGGYTVQVRGVNNTTGVALVEVYELP